MFRKLIASALTVTMLFGAIGTSVYAAETQEPRRVSSFSELTYYEMDEVLEYIDNSEEYPEEYVEMIRQVFALIRDEGLSDEEAMGRIFGFNQRFDPHGRNFDNIFDKMYFFQFGENFEAIQRLSTDINQVFTYGTLQLEVLSSVALVNHMTTARVATAVPMRAISISDALELGDSIELDEALELDDSDTYHATSPTATIRVPATEHVDDGRADVHYYEYEISVEATWPDGAFEVWPRSSTGIQIFTFFSLRDQSGAIDFSTRASIGMRDPVFDSGGFEAFERQEWVESVWPGHVSFLFYDEVSNSGVFVAVHSAHVWDDIETIEVELMIDRIHSNNTSIDEIIELDFASLLDTHEASTFIIAAEDVRGGGGMSGLTEEIMGQNFSIWDTNHEVLTRDELNIPLGHDVYLSNIQLRSRIVNNVSRLFLHVQFNEYIGEFGWPQERWVGASLRYAGEPTVNEGSVIERLFGWSMLTHLQTVYIVDASHWDDYSGFVNNRRHIENIYLIEDEEMLNNLAINIFGSYYANVTRVNVGGTFEIPVNIQYIALEGTASVIIDGVNFIISDIVMLHNRISYNLEAVGNIHDAVELAGRGFFPADHMQITFILDDGREVDFIPSGSGGMSWASYPEQEDGFVISVHSEGNVIDLERVEGVRVNGTMVHP